MELEESKNRPFQCEQCQLTFVLDTSKNAHMAIEHNVPSTLKCTVCNITFYGASVFGQHIFQHCMEFSTPDCIQCCLCSLQYPSEHGLRVHLAVHTGGTIHHSNVHFWRNKSHFCDLCSMVFPGAYKWKKHMQRHETGRLASRKSAQNVDVENG